MKILLLTLSILISSSAVAKIEDCRGKSSEAICVGKKLAKMIRTIKRGRHQKKPGNPDCTVTQRGETDSFGNNCRPQYGYENFCAKLYKFSSIVDYSSYQYASQAANWCEQKLAD